VIRFSFLPGLLALVSLVPLACGEDENARPSDDDDAGLGSGDGSSGNGGEGGSGGAETGAWDGVPTPAPDGAPFSTLAEWHLFRDAPAQEPAEGVVPFDVISVLFADNASKHRFLWVPPGNKITWNDEAPWEFPVGTIAVKTFFYPVDARNPTLGDHLIETRLLVHEADRWVGHVYLWNEEQTEAVRKPTGASLTVPWTNADGEALDQTYEVPDTNQCQQCHGQGESTRPLGPRTRQLDRDYDYGAGPENQIDHFASLGWFDREPPAPRVHLEDPLGTAPLFDRVRAYFDANCGHCHGEGGQAHSTRLHLAYEDTDPVTGNPSNWGICKFPTSAGAASGGFKYDIVPGAPEESIMVHRLESTDDTIQMPPILTKLSDPRGVELVREWIAGMPPRSCDEPPVVGDAGPAVGDAGPSDAGQDGTMGAEDATTGDAPND
jgi:uncharacterized repeat protein (TIGR03806 family)